MDSNKLIIGLDGVPHDMIQRMTDNGTMPFLASLREKDIFEKTCSSIPEISSVAWSSVITGKNPGEHGIFGFTDFLPNSYGYRFPNYTNLKQNAFWDEKNTPSVITNVPSTYPVKDMNGVHISGFVSLDLQRSVYPPALLDDLEAIDYQVDVDSGYAHKSMELFLQDLDKTLNTRHKAFELLWDYIDWQTFMFVFTGTDRLMHFLWDAYEDEDHTYHADFNDHFRKVDTIISEIFSRVDDNTPYIILSDHGFERLDKEIYLNRFLQEKGYLGFTEEEPSNLLNISEDTKAFVLDPARIYLNYEDRFPKGTVKREDGEGLLNDLTELFSSLEVESRKVIKDIYKKEEVFTGPYIDQAPDLTLMCKPGFNLKGSVSSDRLVDKGIFTGKHTYDTAFMITNCKEISTIEKPVKVQDTRRILGL